jgi:sialic acid synthase SpsE
VSAFRDHKVSLTAEEIRELMPRLRRIARLRGSGRKEPTRAELEQDHVRTFRRSVYAARDLDAGEVLTEENLTVLRPADGIPASRFYEVLGRRTARPVKRFHVLCDDDVR